MKIGGLKLFPSVRAASTPVIVASGISCRSQIEQGTRRHAEHLAQVVYEALNQ